MRIVFLSDSHLGFDWPVRPRVERRRRGQDFFDNFDRVLAHAKSSRADLLLHGGDFFFRSKVPPAIVDLAYERLVRFVDDACIPIGIIAGNHDRSKLPTSLLLAHPLIHVFHHASTHVFQVGGARVAVTGVPFAGDGARVVHAARAGVDASHAHNADAHVLMAHEAFEGATCGPVNFTFRDRDDVVPLDALPDAFDVVVSGHIHRRQVLQKKRADGSALPIVYAGSIERTSFAEMSEQKSFVELELHGSNQTRQHGERGRIRFHKLPARPMIDVAFTNDAFADDVVTALAKTPADAIVRITCNEAQMTSLSQASAFRAACGDTRNVEWRVR